MGNCDKLLDNLRECMGCHYISDLHFLFESNRVCARVRPPWVEDGTYALEDWCAAVNYITGQAHAFSTKEEAIGFLFGEGSSPTER